MPDSEALSPEQAAQAEAQRMKTVNFLSKLSKNGVVRETRVNRDSEGKVKELCYFSCSQTLEGRPIHWNSRTSGG